VGNQRINVKRGVVVEAAISMTQRQSVPGEAQGRGRAIESLQQGLNPIVSAAGELLYVARQFQQVSSIEVSLETLRQSLIVKVEAFVSEMRSRHIVRHEHVVAASYVLCTFVDEVISGRPWGQAWPSMSLLEHFHQERLGGDRCFRDLEKQKEAPQENRDVLELMYVCMSYGFYGRYQILDAGKQKHEELRKSLGSLLCTLRPMQQEALSSGWEGVLAPGRHLLTLVPVWVWAGGFAFLFLLFYLLFSVRLGHQSDPVYGGIQGLRVAYSSGGKFSTIFLEKEIREGLVGVKEDGKKVVVTILADTFFDSGSAEVSNQRAVNIIERIGDELANIQGSVVVNGHTDDQPIKRKFKSNWELSEARAESVAEILRQKVDRDRIEVKGSADSVSIGDNATSEGRAKNRRVEITVYFSGK
jgi:type VI secretion system protein ImpK